MAETYDSVLDRISAFNVATEALSKARAQQVTVSVPGRDGCSLRLARTADSYEIEVHGVPPEGAEALTGMGFAPRGDAFVREVRKSERSWSVASQIEDVLQDALALGLEGKILVETA